jgi:hypothetical protein
MSEGTTMMSILDRDASELAKEPDLIPTGIWTLQGGKPFFRTFTNDDGNEVEVLNLSWNPIEPGPGVDEEAAAAGKYRGRQVWSRHYLRTYRDERELRELCLILGINLSAGRSLREAIDADFQGSFVKAEVGLRTYKKRGADDLTKDNSVSGFAAVN